MSIICINATLEGECRVASLVDQKLEYLDIEDSTQYRQKSNIHTATITSIEESLDAVFVNYGGTRHGFLPFKEIAEHYLTKSGAQTDEKATAANSLKVGQKLLVQIEKEQRGTKGAALTTHISLAGSYLVLMPTNTSGGGISKRVDTQERDTTKELLAQLDVPTGMSVIVRTAGVGRTLEELQWDLESLLTHWQSIKQTFDQSTKPQLIHRESDAIIRAVRDQLKPNVSDIIVDDEVVFYKLSQYIQRVRPDYADRVKLHTGNVPLFTHKQIEEQIDKLFSRRISLPSGGSLVIDNTEALTAIDVNSASATKADNIEDTAYQINLEAAEEAVRQIKLRDIGGIIIIDFIDMSSKQKNRRSEIYNHVCKLFKTDKAKTNVKEISELSGIMEISRQRLSPPLSESHLTPCPTCNGHGLVKNTTVFGNEILRKIEQTAVGSTCDLIQVQVPIDTANYILNARSAALTAIKKRFNIDLCILANPNLSTQKYLLKRIKLSNDERMGSEQTTRIDSKVIDESLPTWQTDKSMNPNAGIFNPSNTVGNHPKTEQTSGILKRIWSIFFSTDDKKPQKKTGQRRNNHRRRNQSHNKRRNSQATAASKDHSQNQGSRSSHSNRSGSNRSRGLNRSRRRHSQNDHETTNN